MSGGSDIVYKCPFIDTKRTEGILHFYIQLRMQQKKMEDFSSRHLIIHVSTKMITI